jgi:trans-aconitate methyltransferase
MIEITKEPMFEILDIIENILDKSKIIEIIIPNPDLGSSLYGGTTLPNGSIHHSWRAWSDLATLLHFRMLTPKILSSQKVILRLERLNDEKSFHKKRAVKDEERYGVESIFADINKNEEPAFVYAYRNALKQVDIYNIDSILDLGINRGDEFLVIEKMITKERFNEIKLVGIDHSQSAISKAKETFPQQNIEFYCHNINNIEKLDIPRVELIISIGTLQSPNINFKTLFMSLIQNHLTPNGSIILGFPNSRWVDGEMIYGAKSLNYSFSEMSLVIKDIYFCKKYLQQHKFKVTITGKEYIFLTAKKINFL